MFELGSRHRKRDLLFPFVAGLAGVGTMSFIVRVDFLEATETTYPPTMFPALLAANIRGHASTYLPAKSFFLAAF